MQTFRGTVAASAIGAALSLLAGGAVAQDAPGEGTTLKMARPTWDTGWFHTEIYRQLIEELGYTVSDMLTLDNPVFHESVAYGDVALWVDGWFPLHNTYRPTFEGQAEIVGAVAKGGALEGYLVGKATADELGITSLDDFKRDEVKATFDRDGDGRADMAACPRGWGCEINIEHHLDAYELRTT